MKKTKSPHLWLILIGVSLIATFAQAATNTCSSVRYPAPSGVQNDIEFIFDKPYACGQFANGDWWVSSDSQEGVTIVAITPNSQDGLHGYEVNPSRTDAQAFDPRIAWHTPALMPPLPLRVNTDVSIVKAVSVDASETNCRPCLQFAAVLTVTPSAVKTSNQFFRPGYFGSIKRPFKRYAVPNLALLGRLPASDVILKDTVTFEEIDQRFKHVQLDHITGWTGRNLHPIDNMPDYGADIARDSAVAVLRMLLDDFDISNKSHQSALINYLQMAVDLRSMAKGGVDWPGAGGQGNGRKLPLLLAAVLFDSLSFQRAMKLSLFSEDEQVYFSARAGQALFGRACSDEEYWMPIRLGVGSRDCRDPYHYVDGGGDEIGWGYQYCCTAKPWKYTALAVHLLGAEEAWGKKAFFQYVDRWVTQGAWAGPDRCAAYNGNPDDYGSTYGPAEDGTCIPGKGRYTDVHATNADSGYYDDPFGEKMWERFRNWQ